MEQDVVWLGPAPAEEDCAQIGAPDYRDRAMRECRAYIEAIRKKCGEPPEGACLRVKSSPHDFGSYYEVVCAFDANDQAAADYAYHVDEHVPTTWDEVGMSAPAIPARGRGTCR